MLPCYLALIQSLHVGKVFERGEDEGLRINNSRPDRAGDWNGSYGQGDDSGNNSTGNTSKLILCEREFDVKGHWILSLFLLLWTSIGCSLSMIRFVVIIWYGSYNYSVIKYLFPLRLPWPQFMRTVACRLLVFQRGGQEEPHSENTKQNSNLSGCSR